MGARGVRSSASSVRGGVYGSTIGAVHHLSLAADSEDELIRFEQPSLSLNARPQRPGELAELIEIDADLDVVERLTVEAGLVLPLELALYIAIEAERALTETAELFECDPTELALLLDQAAAHVADRGVQHVLVRPLTEYAAALRLGVSRPGDASVTTRARVPHHVAARWAVAAAAEEVPLERWASQMVRAASGARAPWEAAAAASAQTLGEWVLVQATRSARSRSTVPHTTASG